MTQDRIIELARESQKEKLTAAGGHWFQMEVNDLERFAALVRAQALEEVADMVSACDPRATPKGIAAAIRALKGQP